MTIDLILLLAALICLGLRAFGVVTVAGRGDLGWLGLALVALSLLI